MSLWSEWARLDAPAMEQVAGTLEGRFLGPAGLPGLQRGGLALLGMPGWWGKRFGPDGEGENLLRRGGELVPSLPMHARPAASRGDGRPVIAATYDPDARPPFRWITDELRIREDGSLLAMMFLPGMPRGAPFLLRRVG